MALLRVDTGRHGWHGNDTNENNAIFVLLWYPLAKQSMIDDPVIDFEAIDLDEVPLCCYDWLVGYF